ncbi:hypothetical protein MCOR25_001578 [Pyricularia grisea]|uniref:Aminoacyl-transfer RNA synthetases class-II family profile domain-containing protein n=1 Tax=Pyricularia grisea TaxID=148305 RepID=A0A6P8BHB8_PYRGI|nr:uncharacterized protein PgNI_01002 [Pyricularia grisea]KAI6380642.1 hypothetical protein MCOR25_001578 [Pyricularia grisea]TLD16115.1 hypothetical protein PgNI_01002 [Pyricularia grisea]
MRPIGCLARRAAIARWPVANRLASSAHLRPTLSTRCVSNSSSSSDRSVARLLEWKPTTEAQNVVVDGYVRSVRSMKTASFVALGDGSCLSPLQAIVPVDQASGLSVGTAVRLTGSWVSSPGRGQTHELRVQEVKVVGPSDAKTFPLQKKYHTPEFLRTIPHLRHRTPFNSTLLRLRSEVIRSMSHFFSTRDFVQTHPPVLTSSDCEGAGEVFEVLPASDGQISAEGAKKSAEAFFDSQKYLTVSAQLHLEALAQSVGNVWTLSPTFRAEKSDTPRHLSEFYMMEAEMSFVESMDTVMDLVEDLLRFATQEISGTKIFDDLQHRSKEGADDLATPEEVKSRWNGLMSESWPRITYTDAIRLLESESQNKPDMFTFKPTWGHGLQAEHEKYIARVVGGSKPVFVTHYPRDLKAFYMLQSASATGTAAAASSSFSAGTSRSVPEAANPRETVDCFDLLVPDLCEIAGGSMREHRLQPLLAVMQSRGMVTRGSDVGNSSLASKGDGDSDTVSNTTDAQHAGALEWYVDLRRWGCPPHGGFGIGFDRLLCYLSGVQSIRDIVAFPRWYGRCDC